MNTINLLNFILTIILIINICNKRRFVNRINTLNKIVSLLKVSYWYDYLSNNKKHVESLKNLVKIELNKQKKIKNKEDLIKMFPYDKFVKIYLYDKYEIDIYTLMDKILIDNLITNINNTNNLEGAMVDVGCWRGGSSIIMKSFSKEKELFILDEFKTLDSNVLNDDDHELDKMFIKVIDIISNYFKKPILTTNIDMVKSNFNKLNISMNKVNIIKGNLRDKDFGYDKINKISLLRIDCIFYESTYKVLESLYNKVENGGIIILNSYNLIYHRQKQALLDYFKINEIRKNIIKIGQSAYFVK